MEKIIELLEEILKELKSIIEKEEKATAACAVETQRQQYTTEQVIKKVVEGMFTAFVQSASCDIDVRDHE